MKVTQELVTVWAETDAEEVNVVLAGLRLTLTNEEAALLASGLARSLEKLRSTHTREAAESPAVIVRKDEVAAGQTGSDDAMQLRTRALIQASIRDKGLSLREEPRS